MNKSEPKVLYVRICNTLLPVVIKLSVSRWIQYPEANSVGLYPDRLRERAVGGDIPDFDSKPTYWRRVDIKLERLFTEALSRRQIDSLGIEYSRIIGCFKQQRYCDLYTKRSSSGYG
jgi:hypothetical protein